MSNGSIAYHEVAALEIAEGRGRSGRPFITTVKIEKSRRLFTRSLGSVPQMGWSSKAIAFGPSSRRAGQSVGGDQLCWSKTIFSLTIGEQFGIQKSATCVGALTANSNSQRARRYLRRDRTPIEASAQHLLTRATEVVRRAVPAVWMRHAKSQGA